MCKYLDSFFHTDLRHWEAASLTYFSFYWCKNGKPLRRFLPLYTWRNYVHVCFTNSRVMDVVQKDYNLLLQGVYFSISLALLFCYNLCSFSIRVLRQKEKRTRWKIEVFNKSIGKIGIIVRNKRKKTGGKGVERWKAWCRDRILSKMSFIVGVWWAFVV